MIDSILAVELSHAAFFFYYNSIELSPSDII